MPLGRQFWVVAHRWAGLTLAAFLIVVGATGTLLPWQTELTQLTRPSLSRAAPPAPGAQPLATVELARRVEAATGAKVGFLDLTPTPGHVATMTVSSRTTAPLGYDTVWVDPYSGVIRLKYRDGVLADGPQAIMSFLYSVHRELALGRFGQVVLGVAALVWTIDCIVGFYLTLPLRRRKLPGARPATAPGWWHRWKPAWLVRWTGGRHKLTFDLHRAGGLWVWPVLLVFAWSSVGLNLAEVHGPVMRLFGAAGYVSPPAAPSPLADPPLDRAAAARRGDALLHAIGARRGFTVGEPAWIYYDPTSAAYSYAARSSLDVQSAGGRTAVWLSGVDGRLVRFDPPLPANRADAFTLWLYMLHFGQVFGLPYRIFVSLMGALVVMLSVTGVLVWMRKRSARLLTERRARDRPAGVSRELVAAE